MSLFATKEKSTKYHADLRQLWSVTDAELEKWSNDPDCFEKETCGAILAERVIEHEKAKRRRDEAHATKRAELQDNPFDPRTEVSADAAHIAGRIVKHLWIIFVLLPVVLAILWAIMK